MIVFSNYIKIVKKYIPMLLMYTGIFLFFAVMNLTYGNNKETDFTAVKPTVAIINKDNNTDLIKSFTKYLSSNAELKKVNTTNDDIKDALFFRQVDYVLIIPNDFTKDFMNGEDVKIETLKVPDSYAATFTETLLNNFLNIAKTYSSLGIDEQTLASKITTDLSNSSSVKLLLKEDKSSTAKAAVYYNFTNYTFLAMLILIIGMLKSSFNEDKIKKRNLVSKTSNKQINFQISLANFCITLFVWSLYVLISFILIKDTMFKPGGLLLILNSFIFIMAVLSISILLSNLVKSREGNNLFANVISLGTSFICGAFVPQQYLAESVLNLGKIFPSYWFIKTNNDISTLNNYNLESLTPIFTQMGIVIIFIIIYIICNNFALKLNAKKS